MPSSPWRAAQLPGFATTEVAVRDASLELDPAVVAGWWRELVR